MAQTNRNAIHEFIKQTQKPFLDGIVDLNNNDTFIPKKITSEWISMPPRNLDNTFTLRFGYELNTLLGQPKQWVQLKYWEIESLDGECEQVVLDLKHKSDHVNILIHYMKHTFSSMYACINSSPNVKPFNMDTHFASYKLTS